MRMPAPEPSSNTNRAPERRRFVHLSFGLSFLSTILALPAFADSACVSGNLSPIIGTTCDIGSLQFTFGWSAENYVYNFDPGYVQTPGPAAAASDFTFTVGTSGFTVSGDARTITGPGSGNGTRVDFGELSYDVVDLGGVITGETVSDSGMSASGNGGAEVSAITLAQYGCVCSHYVDSYDTVTATSDIGPVSFTAGNPFSSGNGNALVYELTADGSDTATWNGSSTFTFTTSAVPEPPFAPVAGLGLLGLAISTRRRTRRS